MSPIRDSTNIDLYERWRAGSENFESGARTKKAAQLHFRDLDLRKADARSIICMSIVPGSTGSPSGLLEKKLCFIMCCHFFGPHFWLEKNSFVQKVSKSFKKFRLFKFRRVPISVYTEIPLLLGCVGIESQRFWIPRHGLISFWQNEFSPHPNWASQPHLLCGTCHTADDDCDIVEGGPHYLISFVPLKHRLFCEFLRPLVSKFHGGSEFLTRNWIWEWFAIHLYDTNISQRQVL